MIGSRWRTAVAGLIAASVAWFAQPGFAQAGTYVIRNCNVPGAVGKPVGPWVMNQTPGAFWSDDCAQGGGFGVNAGSLPASTSTGVQLSAPPTIAIRRIRLWIVARLRSTMAPLFAGAFNSNAAGATTFVDLFASPGGSTLTAPYENLSLPADTSSYMVSINCGDGSGTPCAPVDTNVLEVRGVETTLEETVAPTGTINGGDLLAGTAQSGVRPLGYSVSDQGSGVSAVSVLLGSTIAGISDFTSECGFADFAGCPRARSGSVSVDTRKVADGIYPVSIRIKDAAGNEQTVASPTAIQVVNGLTTSDLSRGLSTGVRLIVSFASNHHRSTTVAYGRRVLIRGRVVAPDNAPVAGATVQADELPASRFRKPRTAALTTAADGSFVYTAERGPSRTIQLTYPVSGVSQRLRLRVKSAASIAVQLSGTLVRYRGRVTSTPLPKRGKLVEIQGRAPGAGWKTFAKLRTNRRGAYAGTYRLRVHRPGVRLQFRVRVPKERGYPFLAHDGRPVGRIVR
jgi:hypothetical protein